MTRNTSSRDEALIQWAIAQLPVEGVAVHPMGRGDQSKVYVLSDESNRWFLKLSRNLGPERDRLDWLSGRARAPAVLGFRSGSECDALLMSSVDGTDLSELCKVWRGEEVAVRLADALRAFHKTNIADCPFGAGVEGGVLVHGDACLPNVLFYESGALSGFVDLGEMRVCGVEVDLSAAIWSLQYNLGSGYGLPFLRQYGIPQADGLMVERLRLMYESPSFDGTWYTSCHILSSANDVKDL